MINIDPFFKITEEVLDKCREFAKNSIETSIDLYAVRHDFNPNDPAAIERATDKFSRDITIGKIGEEFVYQKYSPYINLSPPDYQIYSKAEKSWSPDLKSDKISIAVKSQDIRSKLDNDESWIFQLGSKGKDLDKEIFNSIDDNKYVSFVSLNIPKRSGQIMAVVKLSWLHKNNLFKNARSINLTNKSAVYMDDLIEYKEDLFQL